MKLMRKIQFTIYSIFTIVTFKKFYICEYCHKVHKFNGNEFQICGGWYEPYVYVSVKCANDCMIRAWEVLREARVTMWNEFEKSIERDLDNV